jgi:hypothetical protein
MTLGEVEDYEEITGEPIGDVYDNGLVGKATRVLYTIHKRRSSPEWTFEQTRAVNPIAALQELEAYSPKEIPEV